MKQLAVCATAILILTACSESEDTRANVIHDVEYYLANDPERSAMNKRCEDNPALFETDGNCNYAEQARRKKKLDAFVDAVENQQ